jgi:YVTN family beta-propeller protein
VTNHGSGNVSVIDVAANTVPATINVGINPEGIAITPDGTRVYVANSGSGAYNVSVIDTAANKVVASVAVGTTPFGLAISPGP